MDIISTDQYVSTLKEIIGATPLFVTPIITAPTTTNTNPAKINHSCMLVFFS